MSGASPAVDAGGGIGIPPSKILGAASPRTGDLNSILALALNDICALASNDTIEAFNDSSPRALNDRFPIELIEIVGGALRSSIFTR